ncbi:MAG: glycosyltransferase family 4 protein [Verrucomicrobiia bacterium]
MNFEVLYSAAHAEFPDTEPLGGGKAVADYLIREWREHQPFSLTVLSPRSLGLLDKTHPCPSQEGKTTGYSPPPEGLGVGLFHSHKSLAELSELEYARFCREFERAATAEILKRDPRQCVVLSNDISEGPDFGTLGERGYCIVTIFHVDVVEYFTRFYLRGLVCPETAARFRWFGVMPDVLRLVFEKQYQCVRQSARIVVPSPPMKEMILRCYPWCPTEKIVVLPWGDVSARDAAGPVPETFGTSDPIADDEVVIMTLSRLSPEKGIERLLAALPHVDAHGKRLRIFICGGAAYMKGRAYERKLRRLAESVTTPRVEFTGHVVGAEKAALLQRADIFVSPSRHESYGLTIAEALAAGCRVISHNHYGAEGKIVDCSDPRAFGQVLGDMIGQGRTRKAETLNPEPSHAAEQLTELLASSLQGERRSP